MLYLWLKSFHIMSVIAWMAALFYLPRLFVYHAAAAPGSSESELFKVMERRLYKAIMTPAMISTWVFGMWVAIELDVYNDIWFQTKLMLVLGMSALHGYLGTCLRAFAEDRNTKSQRHYRLINEVPTVLMIFIVLLVVLKPF